MVLSAPPWYGFAMEGRCEVKTRLVRDYQASSEAYSRAVVDLSRTVGSGSTFEYEKRRFATEEARKSTHEIKMNLESHTNNHGC